jgi:hypothetical protein
MKPTREQFEAVEAVALAMSALTEIWDEDFNRIYEELGEDVTGDLLTRSFDEMAWAWHGFRYALGDLTKTANRANVSETWDEENTDSPECECCLVLE